MNQTALTINRPVHITANQIASLLCSALEGGIHNWAQWYFPLSYEFTEEETSDEAYGDWVGFPQYMITHSDYKLKIIDCEGGGREYALTLDHLKNGLTTMASKYPRHFNNFLNEMSDAYTGNAFLQCCIFGEVVYG